jgi:hypothetical protein
VSTEPVTGQASYQDPTSHYNAIRFVVQELFSRVRTAILVEVLSCTSNGQIAPAGIVAIQPMVNQVNGAGNAIPHGTIYKVPYLRMQGGVNAIIMDPTPGDIGLAVFADRDISKVQSTGAIANPGSARQFDMADALYLGGYLNATPTQYVAFTENGITIADKNGNIVEMKAGSIKMTTPLLDVTGDIHSNGKAVGSTHEHTDGGGVGNSGPPV